MGKIATAHDHRPNEDTAERRIAGDTPQLRQGEIHVLQPQHRRREQAARIGRAESVIQSL